MKQSIEKRFWEKVNKNGPIPEFRPDLGPCWLWLGSINKVTGYGTFRIDKDTLVYAHRYSYELHKGPIPKGKVSDHLCRVHHCIHPNHIEPVTNKQNKDRGLRGVLRTHCNQGHPWIKENIYTTPKGVRRCRMCIIIRCRNYYQRNRKKVLKKQRDAYHRKKELK